MSGCGFFCFPAEIHPLVFVLLICTLVAMIFAFLFLCEFIRDYIPKKDYEDVENINVDIEARSEFI
jgi:hypothetical protein